MILVDSSVWINFLGSSPSSAGAELRRMIADAEPFALAGVVIAEVLQGLKRDVSRLEHYLSQWDMLDPKGFSTYREAASPACRFMCFERVFHCISRLRPQNLA